MASIESQLFNGLLRFINKKKFLEMPFAFGKFDFYQCPVPPRETLKVCHVTQRTVNGRSVFTLSPRNGQSKKHNLYLHGGEYLQNFVKQHCNILSLLVEQTHCSITAPD